MSVQAMSWALTQQIVTNAAARHVLLCLANYADKEGMAAFPSASTLASDTGLSERTIRYKLDELEQAGVIIKGNQKIVAAYIERGDRRPICYDILIKKRGANDAGRNERGANETPTGCNSRQNGVQLTTERGATAAPNPSIKPSIKPSINPLLGSDESEQQNKTKRASQIPDEFQPTSDHLELAKELGINLGYEFPQFVDYHKSKGSKFKDWNAALRNWIRNARKFAGNSTTPRQSKPGTLRNGTKDINYYEGVSDDGRF